jgi:dienelactone hydrolase
MFVRPAVPPVPVVTLLADGPENATEGAWPDRVLRAISRAELWSFRVATPRAQALIYAGGGYTALMLDKEGVEVALWLNGLGFDAHVVVHRLPGQPDGKGGVFPFDVALTDAKVALAKLAADKPDLPLIHVGLSSGGHLSGTMACQDAAVRVAGALIAYAPINANHTAHKYPPGKPDYPPVEKQAFYDAWPIGLPEHPHGLPKVPVFLAYALTDTAVPVEHALRLIRWAAGAKHDLDAHVFGQAPHGFALRETAGTHAAWTTLAAEWFDRHL